MTKDMKIMEKRSKINLNGIAKKEEASKSRIKKL